MQSSLSQKKYKLFKPILDFFFFDSCLICNTPHQILCSSCIKKLVKAQMRCMGCGLKNPFGLYCKYCYKEELPDRIIGCFTFASKLRELLHSFKYEDITALGEPFAKAMAKSVKQFDLTGFVVVPVPLSQQNKRRRGYNQSELLARRISSILNLEYMDILRVKKAKLRQSDLKTKTTRRQNVKNAYTLISQPPANILLIDDVITTGATTEEISKLLKRTKVKNVVVLTLAIAR